MLLTKGVYPYEYMDEEKGLIETSLPEEKPSHSNVNMRDINYSI